MQNGETIEVAAFELQPGDSQSIYADFALPRRATKGIRLLLDVDQPVGCEISIDDIRLIEWRTTWMPSGTQFPDVQATYVQLRPSDDAS